ncbi:MAG: phytanoyl-CoA dioxygenase family protein [Pseudomonadota bacterium]
MTPEQETSFHEHGYLYLRGALGKDVVQPVKAHVLSELKRLNIWSTGRTLSNRLKGVPVFQQIGKLGQLVHYPALKDRLVPRELHSLMRRLAGVNLATGQDAQLLISLPNQGDWTLEGLNWHRDISQSKQTLIPGIQIFVLLDDLSSHGGATLALAGSHRLKNQAEAKQCINEITRTGTGRSVEVDGIEISVLEMAGRAGDVYLMDMRVIHTPSINSTKNVRMMATTRYLTI